MCIRPSGFTLVELIAVIVILSALAAAAIPRFVNVKSHAQVAAHRYNASTFQSSVTLARAFWMVSGAPSQKDERDNMPVFGPAPTDTLDFGPTGWPVQHYNGPDVVLSTDSSVDCESMWPVLVNDSQLTASRHANSGVDYHVQYTGLGQCVFVLQANPNLSFSYNTLTGLFTVDDDPNT